MQATDLQRLYDLLLQVGKELAEELAPDTDARTVAAISAAYTLGDWTANELAAIGADDMQA